MAKLLKEHAVEERLIDSIRRMEDQSFLPPERKLADDMNVSRCTLRRTLRSLEAQGLIHRIPGKGNIVLAQENSSTQLRPAAISPAEISLFMPSGYIAPYISKIMAGWDDALKESDKCYLLHGNVNPHRQLSNIKTASPKCRVMGLSLLPWKRKILSPLELLSKFSGDLVFILDRCAGAPELGHAVLNNESKGAELALEWLLSVKHRAAGTALFFKFPSEKYSSAISRRLELFRVAEKMSLKIQAVEVEDDDPAALRKYLSAIKKPASVISSDGRMAEKIMLACKELGIHVPDQLTLLSLFESPTDWKIPHVHPDFYAIGRFSGNLAVNLLDGKPLKMKNISIDPVFQA